MKGAIWRWFALGAAMLGLLAACGSPERTPPPLPVPTATPTPEIVPPMPLYDLTLSLDAAARRLSGQEQIVYPNHSGVALDEIVLRLYPNLPQYGGAMQVSQVLLDGQPVPASLRAEDTALAVALPRPLAPEKSATLDLRFDVDIPLKEEGYVLFGFTQGIWSLPDVYPLLAVYDGARWHEEIAPAHGDAVFAEAALYDVTLTLPASLTLIATGPVVGQVDAGDGRRTYRLGDGPMREFAFLAGAGYRQTESTASGRTLRSYYLPGDEAAGEAALTIAATALRVYEDSFGPYPYEEMSVAEAPLLHYGMEFPALNLIGLSLYREHQDELEDRIVHEVAHQWWYAQVGNDQVNTPWLDEGLAEYSMAIYYQEALGEAKKNTLVNQRWLVPYQVAVENNYDAVVNQPAAAFGWNYEVIVYAKAALFFHALHEELGDETFKAVLRTYADRYRWKIAAPDDFLAVAEEVSGQDLDALYSHWILNATGAYPTGARAAQGAMVTP